MHLPVTPETCRAWKGDGPCGEPSVERLCFLNPNIDWPHTDGRPVCAGCLADYMDEQAL